MLLKNWLRTQPFSLALSSGFFGHFAHLGLLSALEDHDLRPHKISGSSAGALVAGLFASGMSIQNSLELFLKIERKHFWDPALGLGFLKGQLFKDLLLKHLPITKLEHCRIPLSVSLHNIIKNKTEVLKEGNLATALVASCAVPLLFRPVRIGRNFFIDGGISDRAGVKAFKENETILHHHLRDLFDPPSKTIFPDLNYKNVASLHFLDLPQIHPFALERGYKAFLKAKISTKMALSLPVKKRMTI